MFEPMTAETLERLMTESALAATEQQLETEAHARAVQITRSLIAAYGPETAERIAAHLARMIARRLELARPDDVSASRIEIGPA